jgi:hypothetical protein
LHGCRLDDSTLLSTTLESLSDLDRLTVGDFFDPRFKMRYFDLTDVQDIFIARFRKLRAIKVCSAT